MLFAWVANFPVNKNDIHDTHFETKTNLHSTETLVQSTVSIFSGTITTFDFSLQGSQFVVQKKSKIALDYFIEEIYNSCRISDAKIQRYIKTPLERAVAFSSVEAIFPFHHFW